MIAVVADMQELAALERALLWRALMRASTYVVPSVVTFATLLVFVLLFRLRRAVLLPRPRLLRHARTHLGLRLLRCACKLRLQRLHVLGVPRVARFVDTFELDEDMVTFNGKRARTS